MRPTIDFNNPDYIPVLEYRAEALKRLRRNPGALRQLKQYYTTHWADFITDWGMTFDPRKEIDKFTPFILFPRQEDYVNWVFNLWQDQKRGLGEKSRDVGFTWLSAAIAACLWLFHPQSVVGFGSRKKELVDNGDNDPDSIFWKVRTFIDNLPVDFLPDDHREGRKWGVVPNLATGAVIKGEIGDEIGRGGRASIYFADEFAHLEHQDLAESALSQTTDCRIYISTVNGVGNLFYRLRHFLPQDQIFIFDWKDDPRKRRNPELDWDQEPWFLKQARELLPSTLASQVNRDYNAAVANSFIDTELVTMAERRKVHLIEQPDSVPWRVGVDAAGMGTDEIIIWRRRGRLSLPVIPLSKMDGVQLAMRIQEECEQLIKLNPIELISIERDGPGGSAADQLKYGPFAEIVNAVHTGRKLADGKHYNFRAWLHTQAKEYLRDQEVFIPEDNTFKTQGTAIQYQYKGGLLLIESKDDYRSRFAVNKTRSAKQAGRSPDRWDAFVLTFVPPPGPPMTRVTQFEDPFFTSVQWQPLDKVMGY